jgi:hypothetical protein
MATKKPTTRKPAAKGKMMSVAASQPNPQGYTFMYNIVSSTAYAGDKIATMTVTFMVLGQLLWSTQLNFNNRVITTNQDLLQGSVGIKAGSTINLNVYGPTAQVTFNGVMTDGAGTTMVTNQQIALYTLTQ